VRAPAPAYAADLNGETVERARSVLGPMLLRDQDRVGEVSLFVERERLVEALVALRDTPGLEYQQLMEIAGVDYPDRAERFEVVYMLLSLTRNHRVQVRVHTDEEAPVPSVTGIWPVAGWLEREVYDLFGVLFEGNNDLRRILTDYGFRGHPLRKDFPQTGYVEVRYSEAEKRVVYEPVKLAQDYRNFEFQSPWEGAAYQLPGDEKSDQKSQQGQVPQEKGAQTPLSADTIARASADKAPSEAPVGTSGSYAKGTNPPGDAAANAKPADPDVVPSKGQGQNQ